MNIKSVIEYLGKLPHGERHFIYNEVSEQICKQAEQKRQRQRDRYNNQNLLNIACGENLKKIVAVGDIIKCRGTKDGKGIREVLEVHDEFVQCRKIQKRTRPTRYLRDHYLTQHGWDKVESILCPVKELIFADGYLLFKNQ